MGTSTIIYILSVVASLYATYLLAYYLYDVPDSWEEREPKRIVMPRIAYICFMAMAFMPVINTIALILFVVMPQVGKLCGDFQIKSWLFEKPEVKADNTDNNPEKK